MTSHAKLLHHGPESPQGLAPQLMIHVAHFGTSFRHTARDIPLCCTAAVAQAMCIAPKNSQTTLDPRITGQKVLIHSAYAVLPSLHVSQADIMCCYMSFNNCIQLLKFPRPSVISAGHGARAPLNPESLRTAMKTFTALFSYLFLSFLGSRLFS